MKQTISLILTASLLLIGLTIVSGMVLTGTDLLSDSTEGEVDKSRCDQLQAQAMTDTAQWDNLNCEEEDRPFGSRPGQGGTGSGDPDDSDDDDSDDSCSRVLIGSNEPQDPNDDGLYEDLDGDGAPLEIDEIESFNQDAWQKISDRDCLNDNRQQFDFNSDGDIDYEDHLALWQFKHGVGPPNTAKFARAASPRDRGSMNFDSDLDSSLTGVDEEFDTSSDGERVVELDWEYTGGTPYITDIDTSGSGSVRFTLVDNDGNIETHQISEKSEQQMTSMGIMAVCALNTDSTDEDTGDGGFEVRLISKPIAGSCTSINWE